MHSVIRKIFAHVSNLQYQFEWKVDCASALSCQLMWKSVALAWTLRSSTNVEEAVRSRYRSRRTGGVDPTGAGMQRLAAAHVPCRASSSRKELPVLLLHLANKSPRPRRRSYII